MPEPARPPCPVSLEARSMTAHSVEVRPRPPPNLPTTPAAISTRYAALQVTLSFRVASRSMTHFPRGGSYSPSCPRRRTPSPCPIAPAPDSFQAGGEAVVFNSLSSLPWVYINVSISPNIAHISGRNLLSVHILYIETCYTFYKTG